MRILSVDPGEHGAFAIHRESLFVAAHAFDEFDGAADLLRALYSAKADVAVIEEPLAMPGQNVKSTLAQGHNHGYIEALCDLACGCQVNVHPRTWTAAMCAKMGKVERAFLVGEEWRRHDGIVDAILIGRWFANEREKAREGS